MPAKPARHAVLLEDRTLEHYWQLARVERPHDGVDVTRLKPEDFEALGLPSLAGADPRFWPKVGALRRETGVDVTLVHLPKERVHVLQLGAAAPLPRILGLFAHSPERGRHTLTATFVGLTAYQATRQAIKTADDVTRALVEGYVSGADGAGACFYAEREALACLGRLAERAEAPS